MTNELKNFKATDWQQKLLYVLYLKILRIFRSIVSLTTHKNKSYNKNQNFRCKPFQQKPVIKQRPLVNELSANILNDCNIPTFFQFLSAIATCN